MNDDGDWTALVPFGQGIVIPALLADAGEETSRQAVDFFTVKIRNKNTRRAYSAAIARLTGITAYLQNGGTLEKAQQIACHESPRTTKLYDRGNNTLTLDEIERIML